MHEQVVNVKTHKGPYFLVDRRTRWGNPFRLAHEMQRVFVIRKFEVYARHKVTLDPHWLDAVRAAVRGNIPLGCHCHPQLCHADILVTLIEEGY